MQIHTNTNVFQLFIYTPQEKHFYRIAILLSVRTSEARSAKNYKLTQWRHMRWILYNADWFLHMYNGFFPTCFMLPTSYTSCVYKVSRKQKLPNFCKDLQ